jgi:hypothetical protein
MVSPYARAAVTTLPLYTTVLTKRLMFLRICYTVAVLFVVVVPEVSETVAFDGSVALSLLQNS